MTVEDMVNRINDWKLLIEMMGLPDRKEKQMDECNAIIAALKAGQVMANHLNKCINHYNPPYINYEDTLPVLIAWDAITRDA